MLPIQYVLFYSRQNSLMNVIDFVVYSITM